MSNEAADPTNKAFINSVFHTIQGEGANSGRAALFVRMPYCNLACSWCDTTFNTYETWTKDAFKQFALTGKERLAVVTGGEPLMHKHTQRVIDWLKELGYEVAIETNGTQPPLVGVDFYTCSPKSGAEYDVHPTLWAFVNEFKYVIDKDFDWEILERHRDEQEGVILSLSPEFNEFQTRVDEIVTYIKNNPRWRLSLQTHKFIGVA